MNFLELLLRNNKTEKFEIVTQVNFNFINLFHQDENVKHTSLLIANASYRLLTNLSSEVLADKLTVHTRCRFIKFVGVINEKPVPLFINIDRIHNYGDAPLSGKLVNIDCGNINLNVWGTLEEIKKILLTQ